MKRFKNAKILEMAGALLKKLGIENVDVMEELIRNPILPMILFKGGFQIWLDNDFFAYSSMDENEVHYVFANKKHINGELKDIPKLLKTERNAGMIHLLKGIQLQLVSIQLNLY